MKTSSCVSVGLVLFLALAGAPRAWTQTQQLPADGWQGPRPVPQKPLPKPAPQYPVPSGKQVLEIPPQSPQPVLPLPKRQATVPLRPQPEAPRPTQLLTVTVTDPQGQYVPGLQPEDFLVYEEDLPQKITYFSIGQEEPVSLGFLVDTSGSMLNKIGRARQALHRFIETIRPRDEVFLEGFSQHPAMLQDFTDSPTLLDQGTTLLEPHGETALYDALLDGLRRVKQGHNQKRALVVLTDGLDTASQASLREAINAVRHGEVTVYTIGIGNPASGARIPGLRPPPQPPPMMRWPGRRFPGMGMGFPTPPPLVVRGGGPDEAVDVQVLQTFSNETGGRHFLLNTADVLDSQAALTQAVQTISDELRHQYTVGYNSPLRGDVYRSVRVELRRAGLSARTRKGSG